MTYVVSEATTSQLPLGIATVAFLPKEVPGQVTSHGPLVADMFVGTNSSSPLIFATAGHSQAQPANTHHITNIIAEPHVQGGQNGVRLRVNFVADAPPQEELFEITVGQVGATHFTPPEMTTW